jgi:predicted ribosomally synthesized peptide with SipW-like signal peptide
MATTATQRKVLAVLAGGLVLGIGTAVTLAAWNDSEFANGTFTAGAFNLEGSIDGTAYAEHDTAGTAADVTFSSDFDNLSPADVVYAPFWVRLDAATTTGAVVTTSLESGTGANAANISYAIYAIGAAAACDSSATGGTLLLSGTSLSASTAGATFTLAAPVDPDPGVAQKVCIIATAGAGLTEGGTATGVWEFAATSN